MSAQPFLTMERGAAIALLLGVAVVFPGLIMWYGFALPLGPLLGIAQLVALGLAWNTLR